MRSAWLALLLAGALAAGGGTEPVLGWSKMVWSEMKVAGRTLPHAALSVEVAIDGFPAPALMQLDTGAINWVYRVPKGTALQRTVRGGHEFSISGTAAGRRFHDEWFRSRKDGEYMKEGKPVIGTLGAPFFENRILILDLVASKVAILDTELPAAVEHRAAFTPLEYRDGKMFVAFQVNGREERLMFFDSGSSAFAMVTTRRRWQEMTGRQPADTRNEKWDVNSWGKTARMVGAPLNGQMCFGRACVPSPLVFFESGGLKDGDFDQYPYKASGLFGNGPFDGRVTVIVDVAHRRFGLIAGSLANLIPR
jgi:hypothetical protein